MHQAGFLADVLPQHRAVTAAEDHREQVEDRRVVVRQARDRPGQRGARRFDFLKAMLCPRGELERLGRDEHRGEFHPGRGAEMVLDGGFSAR